jgi:hypothetical protein
MGESGEGEIGSRGKNFGRSIDELFNHSWREESEEKWIWVQKPMVVGGRSTQPGKKR